MSRNGQIWADGVQFIQTLTWISTATTTSTTNSGAYPYTLYVYIYVYVHESIDSTAKTNNNTQQPAQSHDRCNKSESLDWIRQLTFILFYRLRPGNCNFEHSLWLSPELRADVTHRHQAPALLTRPRLSPLAWLRSLETRRDWHRALSLLPRHPTLLCLATDAKAQFKILHNFLE